MPGQNLSWAAMKSKEDALTLALLENMNQAFGVNGGRLRAELDVRRRLSQDFVLVLPTGEQVTIEVKFEDYPLSLFPEVLQLVVRQDGTRLLEPGWVYKTTAQFLLYVSPVSGRAVLVSRQRVLQLQVHILQDVLLQSARYDHPALLNAALNPPEKGRTGISRAGIGLGLLLTNVLDAYRLHYGQDGLYEFDVTPALQELKARLSTQTGHSPYLVSWAAEKLLSEPFARRPGLIEPAELGWMLALNPNVNQGLVSNEPLPPLAYAFFKRAACAGLASGQDRLFSGVAGDYRTATGQVLAIGTPENSKLGVRHKGRKLTRDALQRRTPAELSALLEQDESLTIKRHAYLDKVDSTRTATA